MTSIKGKAIMNGFLDENWEDFADGPGPLDKGENCDFSETKGQGE